MRYIALALLYLAAAPLFAQTPNFAVIDQVMQQALADHELPGAVVLVGSKGHVVFRKAYGERSLEPTRESMTADTIFDMASLTKPLITAVAAMQLFEQGRFRLDDPAAKYIPEFAAAGKDKITIRDLLTHYSGLAPDLDLTQPWQGKDAAFRLANEGAPITPHGMQFRYSDINFIVLQEIIEKLSGMSLDIYANLHILGPLHLQRSRFLPPADWLPSIAPTEYDEHHSMLRGIVHDPTARRMGGVAGDAGFFSTADDVSTYAQALLDRLAGRPSSFPLSRLTLALMTRPAQPSSGTALRGLGWDIDSPFSGNRGDLFPLGSFGHTGFTGTSLWVDPVSDCYVILLANGVHPHAGHPLTALRGKVANAAAEALQIDPTPSIGRPAEVFTDHAQVLTGHAPVLTGVDVLEQQHFAPLAELARAHGGSLRAALLTNQTGLDAHGRSTADILLHDAASAVPGFMLTTLFSPEHGIEGKLDREGIAGSTDTATRLPVISLYGDTAASRRPAEDQLRSLDVVIIDLQDAGVRFYTYETLVGYFLEVAARTKTAIVILDRPNPITGSLVQGPVSDAGRESYTDYMPLPVRHGLTLGELAGYIRGERHLSVPLTVIKMQGWRRDEWFDATGLQWTNPSPNLRSLSAATLYPGVALLEATNISVGRGTDTPFEHFGAPWIDGRALAAHLSARMLPGIGFVPVEFTPTTPYPYAGQLCHGVALIVTDRNTLDAPEMGVELIAALAQLYPAQFETANADRLLVHQASIAAILRGTDPGSVAALWQADIQSFKARARPYFLYGCVSQIVTFQVTNFFTARKNKAYDQPSHDPCRAQANGRRSPQAAASPGPRQLERHRTQA